MKHKEVAVRACMQRLLQRYDEVYARQLYRPDGSKPHHFTYVRDWFKARHDALRREFAEAINEDEHILGKHWHYDYYINRSTYGWGSR